MARRCARWATIAFFGLNIGYKWATFVFNLMVAHIQSLKIHIIAWLNFHLTIPKSDNNLVSINVYFFVFLSKFKTEDTPMGFMGCHCSLLFKYGLPLGYFCV